MEALVNVLLLTVAILIVAWLIPAIHIRNIWTAIVVALVYSVINFFFGWLFILLSLPFLIITLGLFKIVINAILLWITDKLVPDFKIDGFGWTLVAAVLIGLISTVLKLVF